MKIATLILYMGTMTTSLVAQETVSGWYEISNPSNGRFNDMAFINADTGYIVGNNGLILSTVDSGDSWTKQIQLTNHDLNHIEFISDTDGFIVSDSGLVIMRTVDSGNSWSVLTTNHSYNLEQVVFLDSNVGYAWRRPTDPRVLKTEDGGYSWTDIGWYIPYFYSFHSLVKQSDSTVIAVINCTGCIGGVAARFFEVTNDNYEDWIASIAYYSFEKSYPAEDGYLYVSLLLDQSEPKLYRTTDHSYTFKSLERVYTGPIGDITYSHGWYLASTAGGIITSTNGAEWVKYDLYGGILDIEILSKNDAIYINNNDNQGGIKKTNTRGVPTTLNIHLYPNPTHNKLSIIVNTESDVRYNVYNSIGKLQISGTLTNSTIDLSALSPTIYYIKFIIDDISKTHKILKVY